MTMPGTNTGPYRVGADIGGTFTDLVLSGPDGIVTTAKVLSTPDEYGRGIITGLNQMLDTSGVPAQEISGIVHGTTVVTNALLENQGARTALITTQGFRDVLELRRLRVPQLYNLAHRPPRPIVDRRLRYEITERIAADGTVIEPLDVAALRRIADELATTRVGSVAVCLLHSYRNPVHERAAAEIIRERLPDVYLSLSVDVLPEIREYERTSTTVVNAFVGPIVKNYLTALRRSLDGVGVPAPLLIMQSSGGVMSASLAAEKPAHMVESGPAAGVIAAQVMGGRSRLTRLIAFDMGGTTAKASLIEDAEVSRTTEYEVGASMNHATPFVTGTGHALKLPMIDIAEVGSGGGSIATVDRSGSLKVGPRSAGSVPGPACYGRGGSAPTVTDANVVLGYINPGQLAGGNLTLRPELAEDVLNEHVARPLGLSVHQAAYGIHTVVNASMIRAIKSVSTNRGRDPRDFALFAFGGNGAVHAAAIAQEMGIRQVIVPPRTGVLSAVGLLEAGIEHHFVQTFIHATAAVPLDRLDAAFAALEQRAVRAMGREHTAQPGEERLQYLADVRYIGQAHEITVPFARRPTLHEHVAALEEDFAREHERTYGHRSPDVPTEFFNLRVIASVQEPRAPVLSQVPQIADPRGRRRAYFGPALGLLPTPVVTRSAVGADRTPGPLIVEEQDATVVVPPGCSVSRDSSANLIIEIAG
ncbi:hydantoinase/oxoprolinase family protein [Actinomadura madurae]|uniref:hydantoinase/oxoprolinase family protein n=2 Tax=Actinomadura madurae TaxID=1993 RepID=UPI0020D24F6C|nr:hydantoinase/oxoprolinase family protein [Actinomadura madurae]MCP9955682.1 hydantoinase/oxoprolinase family protein [Actinomadura madurae]